LRAIAFDPRHQVGSRRVEGEHGCGNTFGFEYPLEVLDGSGFAARRIACVDLYQRTVMPQNLGLLLFPIDWRHLSGGDRNEQRKQGEQLHTLQIIATWRRAKARQPERHAPQLIALKYWALVWCSRDPQPKGSTRRWLVRLRWARR